MSSHISNPFQSSWMHRLLQEVPGYKPHRTFVKNAAGENIGSLQALLIREGKGLKGLFSSRAIVYGGPIIKPDTRHRQQVFEKLVDNTLADLKKKSIYIQFRNFNNLTPSQHHYLLSKGFRFSDELNFLIPLKPNKNPLYEFRSSRRWQVRKGLAAGATIIADPTKDQLDAFLNILSGLYARKVKKPLAEKKFFYHFFDESKRKTTPPVPFDPTTSPSDILQKQQTNNDHTPKCIYLLVAHQGAVIGGVLLLLDGDPDTGSAYLFYSAGLDKQYRSVYPSVLANWGAIHYAWLLGYQNFDFLGAGNPAIPYGVREFKAGFGGVTTNYGRYLRINKPALYYLGKMAVKTYSSLKRS